MREFDRATVAEKKVAVQGHRRTAPRGIWVTQSGGTSTNFHSCNQRGEELTNGTKFTNIVNEESLHLYRFPCDNSSTVLSNVVLSTLVQSARFLPTVHPRIIFKARSQRSHRSREPKTRGKNHRTSRTRVNPAACLMKMLEQFFKPVSRELFIGRCWINDRGA